MQKYGGVLNWQSFRGIFFQKFFLRDGFGRSGWQSETNSDEDGEKRTETDGRAFPEAELRGTVVKGGTRREELEGAGRGGGEGQKRRDGGEQENLRPSLFFPKKR